MKRFLPIILILFVAFAFRFYMLSMVPPDASLDEASIGYNAYSILKTGRDEYGTKFPLLLRAYDDYRPAIYVYLVVPFVAWIGLTISAVRMPSVILSVVDVLLLYLLVKKLLGDNKHSEYVARLASLLLAISPWHIVISRLGHEANLGLFFTILGTYFFTIAVSATKKPYMFIWSALAFVGSIYGYQSQKLIIPVLLILWGFVFWKKLWTAKFWVIMAVLVGLVVAFPMIRATTSTQGMARFSATSDITLNNPQYRQDNIALLAAQRAHNVFGVVWYNRRLTPIKIIANNYIKHFDPVWLFSGAQNESFKVPYMGLLYPWEMLFIVLGFIIILKDKATSLAKKILIPVLFTAPLAAAITTQAPHAMRAYTSIPIYQILASIGFIWFFTSLGGKTIKRVSVLVGLMVVVWSGVTLVKQYFIVLPKVTSESYQYALHKSMQYVIAHRNEYDTVVVSNERDLSQSYMFYLFDSAYTPIRYQSSGGTVSGGFAERHTIGNIIFRPIQWENELPGRRLYVGNQSDFGIEAKVIESFRYLDGKIGVVAAIK